MRPMMRGQMSLMSGHMICSPRAGVHAADWEEVLAPDAVKAAEGRCQLAKEVCMVAALQLHALADCWEAWQPSAG